MKNQAIRQILYIGLIGAFALGLWLYNNELYGDVFRFMLIPLGIIWLIQKQFVPLRALLVSCAIIFGITFGLKFSFNYAAHTFMDSAWIMDFVEIARRPINGEFKGFPSGHTASAFIAAALAWRYLGVRWGVYLIILAGFVGYSRILNLWHTPLQVCAGAILGFFGTLLVLKAVNKYLDKHSKKGI